MRSIAGRLAVGLLHVLSRLPVPLVGALGTILLPFYIPFRRRTRERLRKLEPPVRALDYNRMRLRLALLSLRHVLGLSDGCTVIVEGGDAYQAALASGDPVVLLGWHQGPVELLHRIPAADASSSGEGPGKQDRFFVMTAAAFSSVLSDWITRGRRASGITVIRPDDTASLRRWARSKGVLAVMIDQVPGRPEEWIVAEMGPLAAPYPARLMAWITARKPQTLAVSVRWNPGDRIVFRYERIDSSSLKTNLERLMGHAVRQAPDQYNWSYPKIRVM
jgi:lauroyl/myristoyl acyltransferase